MPAIKIENLSKKYIIGHQKQERYTALRDVMMHKMRGIGQRLRHPLSPNREQVNVEEFWALKDIDLEIQQGDRVGIIGRNGAGKSTLLKVLSRITELTSGRITLNGRVASLLEVGTGFHPELSGRENIYLNGAILGMPRTEIKRKFDEIVDFSGVEKFLDTPVKRYSSGMYVRLAFAVAAHLEPEILIVDEVLAVGDAEFQKKCLGKMEDVGKDGRTVLFVSHNMVALKKLCEKGVYIRDGKIVEYGLSDDVVSLYLQSGVQARTHQVWNDKGEAPGNESARLHSAKISYDGESTGKILTVASRMSLQIQCWNLEEGSSINFSVVIYNSQDVCILNVISPAHKYPLGLLKGVCHIPGNFLNNGVYRVRILIVKDMSHILIDVEDALTFEVQDVPRSGAWYGEWIGAVRPQFEWETMAISKK